MLTMYIQTLILIALDANPDVHMKQVLGHPIQGNLIEPQILFNAPRFAKTFESYFKTFDC